GREASTHANRVIKNALFDLCLLSTLSTFDGVDEIERRQPQLVQPDLFCVDDFFGRWFHLLNQATHISWTTEQSRRPRIQVCLGNSAKRMCRRLPSGGRLRVSTE